MAATFGKSQWNTITCQLKYGCQPCNTSKIPVPCR